VDKPDSARAHVQLKDSGDESNKDFILKYDVRAARLKTHYDDSFRPGRFSHSDFATT